MTTVAANLERMAGDSQVTYSVGKGYLSPKLFRIGPSIFGIAGDNHSNVFIEWAQSGFKVKQKPNWGPKEAEDVEFEVLELSPTGLWIWDRTLVRIKIKDDTYAIGSGAGPALVFMRKLGLTPEEAVKETCAFDDYTREPVDVLILKQPEK
jgi:hypothetical protein